MHNICSDSDRERKKSARFLGRRPAPSSFRARWLNPFAWLVLAGATVGATWALPSGTAVELRLREYLSQTGLGQVPASSCVGAHRSCPREANGSRQLFAQVTPVGPSSFSPLWHVGLEESVTPVRTRRRGSVALTPGLFAGVLAEYHSSG